MRREHLPIPSVPTAICSSSNNRTIPAKIASFSKFVTWVLHEGQSYAAPLRYAPLPEKVMQRSNSQLNQIALANKAGTVIASCNASLGLAKPTANPGVKLDPETTGQLFSD
jgi:hypothetical protein